MKPLDTGVTVSKKGKVNNPYLDKYPLCKGSILLFNEHKINNLIN